MQVNNQFSSCLFHFFCPFSSHSIVTPFTFPKAHPGKITDEELEKEVSGSSLRYSFDIREGKVTPAILIMENTFK
jgi:hypothetical protein